MRFPHIHPMKLGRRAYPFDDPSWLCELKWDGFRVLAYVDQGRSELRFRNGMPFKSWTGLTVALGRLKVESAVLDGEVVCLDREGRPDFDALFHCQCDPYFYAFDLLWLNGSDLRELPLVRRKQTLATVLTGAPDEVRYVHHVEGSACELFFQLCCEHDLEGVVCKRVDSTYLEGDHESAWLKIPNRNYLQAANRPVLLYEDEP
jgi:bifunctional non-homologous end joining protein LigD